MRNVSAPRKLADYHCYQTVWKLPMRESNGGHVMNLQEWPELRRQGKPASLMLAQAEPDLHSIEVKGSSRDSMSPCESSLNLPTSRSSVQSGFKSAQSVRSQVSDTGNDYPVSKQATGELLRKMVSDTEEEIQSIVDQIDALMASPQSSDEELLPSSPRAPDSPTSASQADPKKGAGVLPKVLGGVVICNNVVLPAGGHTRASNKLEMMRRWREVEAAALELTPQEGETLEDTEDPPPASSQAPGPEPAVQAAVPDPETLLIVPHSLERSTAPCAVRAVTLSTHPREWQIATSPALVIQEAPRRHHRRRHNREGKDQERLAQLISDAEALRRMADSKDKEVVKLQARLAGRRQ